MGSSAGASGCASIETLSAAFTPIDKATMPDYQYEKKTRWSGITKKNISRAIERGARIALGTDAAIAPHGVNLKELGHLVELGMDPMSAIVAGTRTSAELLGLADRLGTLTVGRTADLILCDGDPLTDIGVLGDPANIVCVVQDGVIRKDLLLPTATAVRQP